MKTGIIAFFCLIGGYLLGMYFPAQDFIFPKQEFEFGADYTIPAGSRATSRLFFTSAETALIPIEIIIEKSESANLKLVPK